MSKIEKIAAEMFRHVSHQVKGTSLDMKVNPYTISLTETPDTISELAIGVDESIQKDVNVMWFYDKK